MDLGLAPATVELTHDESALLEGTREYARNELLPRDRRWDRGESSVVEVLPQLAEMGLLNLLVPVDAGGLGCSYPIYAALIHELAVWSPATAVTVAVHSMVGGIVDRFVSEPLRTELLKGWGDASHFAAFALSEAGAGSDAASAKTSARRVAGGFRINGEKMWVSNGMHAGWIFALGRLEGLPEHQAYVAFMIEGEAAGIGREEIHGKMGIRGSETAVISFSDTFVPDSHVVGDPGKGMAVCLKSLGRGRVGIAAQATGIAEACLTEMVSYARQREQFNQPIGKFQAVGNMIANSFVELAAAKSLVWRASCSVEEGKDDRRATSMAKLFASEAANRIAYRAVQVHGGTGYVNECRVEQLYRDARVTTIYEGTSEIQRIVIGREIAQR
jgi:alkylation response protein AidB-like acyl-CoA dehydrogenase